MQRANDIPVVLILSSWGSGSSAVAGYLDKCGGYTCPPHLRTVDEKTPNAFEPEELRDALVACIDEYSLQAKGSAENFVRFFAPWITEQQRLATEAGCKVVVLKHALLVFVLPAILRMANCRVIVSTRALESIENTRKRRNWHPTLGRSGAQVIYTTASEYLRENGVSHLTVAFEEFRTDPRIREMTTAFCGLSPSPEQLRDADDWLR
ncbi:hypothetical protein [Rhizobium sp. L1K21]|uniref:hypothetical protein n=1 Tax=Rhizobium sp. L1K21 TaxID=2954933 RepID=UPI00209367A9|nr:hypothetical protein [Rhizobium sp. L1K21]MCO6185853.1 hypothetical protein [Rhizobium sp. L1K21]